MAKYDYLKQFLPPHIPYDGTTRNSFYPLPELNEEILVAEKNLDFSFPFALKEFWKELGYGFLCAPHVVTEGYQNYLSNRIYPPSDIADILILGHDSEMISQEVLDVLKPGDMPFFEIGDSCRFLVMRPVSDTPDAVWTVSGIKIEDSFERFIWRLYYECPWFYDDIITRHYADKN